MPEFRSQAKVAVVLAVFVFTAMLYLGQGFLMPLALSVLIAFLLTPCVGKLEAWGLGRVPAVAATVFSASLAIGFSIYVVAGQAVDLANALPGYKDNLRAKVAAFRVGGKGPLKKVSEMFHELTEELVSREPEPTAPTRVATGPLPVEVVGQQTTLLSLARVVSGSLLSPLGTSAVVVVFVIFMLIERRDLRARFIHLVGRGQLRITTQAIDDAAGRVSRYLLAQFTVNLCYGLPIGLGLWFIGIPNAALFGFVAVMLRFVPYLGSWIAAALPVALSFAISPGWSPLILTVALYVVMELVTNNVIEPWLYGVSTGLSPTAVVVSAVFWTWLWGIGGLLLATPLTVCFAVLGKHVPDLAFLDVLLGGRAPIQADERFYQRLLAGDETELFEMIADYDERGELGQLFDEVILPSLRQGEQDFSVGGVTRAERSELFQRVREALGSLDGWHAAAHDANGDVIIVPAHSEGDHLSALMLAHLLARSGVSATVVSQQTLNSEVATWLGGEQPRWLCVCALTPATARGAGTLIRRLMGRVPPISWTGRAQSPKKGQRPCQKESTQMSSGRNA